VTIDWRTEDERQLVAWTRDALPAEACGLLLGRGSEGGLAIERVVLARNATTEPAADRYEVHPEDFVAADAAARELGLEVVGAWHSHPSSRARPSSTDRERAWDDFVYAIVGLVDPSSGADGPREVRAYRLADGAFRELARRSGAAEPLDLVRP
jgi:proteasome lid subunit RPN8/RPN11